MASLYSMDQVLHWLHCVRSACLVSDAQSSINPFLLQDAVGVAMLILQGVGLLLFMVAALILAAAFFRGNFVRRLLFGKLPSDKLADGRAPGHGQGAAHPSSVLLLLLLLSRAVLVASHLPAAAAHPEHCCLYLRQTAMISGT